MLVDMAESEESADLRKTQLKLGFCLDICSSSFSSLSGLAVYSGTGFQDINGKKQY